MSLNTENEVCESISVNISADDETTINTSTLTRFAIVGRPNVGKSTFFNLLTESRNAVVKNRPGVTRDIQSGFGEVWGKGFEVLDTGGVTDQKDIFSQRIKEQVNELVGGVDFLLVVMDGKFGLCPEDREIIKIAKNSGKDFIVIVNKVDSSVNEDLTKSEFYEFGKDVYSTSFEQRLGISEVFQWMNERMEEVNAAAQKVDYKMTGISLAFVGKPNVGKSSLCNFLLGENRMMVSDIAGTTIDSIDSQIFYDERKYVLTDTAGLRRNAKRKDDVEIISAFKSHDAIDRSDIVLVMVDGTEGPTEQDAKIVSYVLEKHKGVLLVINKSDLGEQEMAEYRKKTREQVANVFHFFTDIPLCFVSAKTGSGVKKMFQHVDELWHKLHMKIPTSHLNEFFSRVIRQAPAPVYGTRNVKFYYLTQTKQVPPSFIAFANHPDGVDPAYRRFLSKRIKERWELQGVPVRIFVMKSKG